MWQVFLRIGNGRWYTLCLLEKTPTKGRQTEGCGSAGHNGLAACLEAYVIYVRHTATAKIPTSIQVKVTRLLFLIGMTLQDNGF